MIQQLQLLGRRVHLFPVHDQLIGIQVDDQLVEGQLLAGVVGDLRPAQHRVDPGQQLLHLKGLDDIVVSAHLQALDPVKDLAFGREHDDGDLGGLPNLGANRPAVHHRKHDVQQNEIRLLLGKLLQRLAAVGGDADIKALLHQIHTDQIRNIAVIFHNQYIPCHGISSPCPVPKAESAPVGTLPPPLPGFFLHYTSSLTIVVEFSVKSVS